MSRALRSKACAIEGIVERKAFAEKAIYSACFTIVFLTDMKLPSLGAFRVFDVAARTQSFVKAAEILHVTHGAVSRQIRLLEEELGVELFERRNRAVFLTHAGQTLQATTSSIFEQLEGAVKRVKEQAHEHVLVLSCEPTIAMKWLIPRLPAFHSAHPDIQLHLFAAGGPIDFQRAGVDLAIRRDDFRWGKEIHATTICDEWVGPVCTRTYLKQSAGSRQRLHSQSRPAAWKAWQRVSGVDFEAGGDLRYEHFYLCIQAAVAGLGVAMSSSFMVQDELARGHLVAPYGFVKDGSRYCLLSPQALEDDERQLRFAQWVTHEMEQTAGAAESLAAGSGLGPGGTKPQGARKRTTSAAQSGS